MAAVSDANLACRVDGLLMTEVLGVGDAYALLRSLVGPLSAQRVHAARSSSVGSRSCALLLCSMSLFGRDGGQRGVWICV